MKNNSSVSDTKPSITRKIAITAILLALCIVSQFLKNLSVYITGPIVNLCLILAVMTAGLMWGLILAVITPLTAFIIAASPVMTAVPGIIPLIMLGNAVLVICVNFIFKPSFRKADNLFDIKAILLAIVSCAAKGCIMGLTIALWLLPTFIPEASPLRAKMSVFQTMFSITQFVTALIGFVYFYIVWKPVKKVIG